MSIFSKLSSLSSEEKKRNKKYHIGFLAIGTRESGKAKKGCLNGQKKKSHSLAHYNTLNRIDNLSFDNNIVAFMEQHWGYFET